MFMRSIEGQRSDRVARKRSPEEKRAQLKVLKERLAAMKSHESPALRASITKGIEELEKELAAPSPAGKPRKG
jgi:hypothetical protein